MSEAPPLFAWRVRQVMALRDVRTQRDLRRALAAKGYVVSSAQLSRLVNGRPDCLNLRLLRGLCDVLACDVGDLLAIPGRRLQAIDPVVAATMPVAAPLTYVPAPFDEELGPGLPVFPLPGDL